MDSRQTEWWKRHGWTVAILLTAFAVALLLRTVFAANVINEFGTLYVYGGGSDSYYHSRVTSYIILNHQNLIHDPLLRYPLGYTNPREPLFDWMNAALGIVFAGAWGGNGVVAGSFFLSIQGPLWAALSVFPIYLIGKEVRNRRVGLLAAIIFPFLVANIESSTLGYANYLSFYTFFMLVTVYSYLRTVKAVGSHRWVESYRQYRSIPAAIRAFVRTERSAVKWAVFTGVSFAALALAWQGYSLVVAFVVGFIVVALIVERIRRVDSFGLYIATWIVGLVGFPIAMPYYLVQGEFAGWFDIPLLVFFGALLVALPFMILRDQPWIVSIPVFAGTAGFAVLILYLINPVFLTTIVTGQGYFVKTLVYSTVAEAQAPSIDSLVLGYGVITFFIAFVGVGLLVWALIRHRWPRVILAFLVFAVISIYLPISAAKFFYVGSAAFAILPAEAIIRALDAADFPSLRRNLTALSDRRGKLTAFRRSFKLRQALILLLVVGILLPNAWYAIDAGIPENLKAQYSLQIYDTLPAWARTPLGTPQQVYLGAAGVELDTPNQYDSAGYNWLAQQDTNLPLPERPAFVSWWDYGFQAVDQGQHPTVADNFQNGIIPSGNFLLSQNESLAIAILATTLLNAEQNASGIQTLPPELNTILAGAGVNVTTLHTYLTDQSLCKQLVIANPQRYLPVDSSTLSGLSAMYLVVSYFLADTLTPQGVANVYNLIQSYTGWTIRYAMVDTRLFPFSASNTGIFYAPAQLTGRVIGTDGVPTTFYTITFQGSDGNTYPLGATLPSGVTQVTNDTINYLAPFYNTMLYHIFVGYNGTDIGVAGGGIPGLNGGVATGYGVEPGWMLSHFLVVYRTAYYCAGTTPQKNPSCFAATNYPDAPRLANETRGVADTSTDSYYAAGQATLAYFPGQPIVGTLTLPNGQPVGGVRLTVYDSWNIPHQSVVTGPTGTYSLILPPGNDTLNVTTGPLNGLRQAGSTVLTSLAFNVPNALGFSLSAPTLVRPIMLQPARVFGTVYWNAADNSSYQPADPLVVGGTVTLSGAGLTTLTAITNATGGFDFPTIAPGVYNYTVSVSGHDYPQAAITAKSGASVNQSAGLVAGRLSGFVKTTTGTGVPDSTVAVDGPQGLVATTSSGLTGAYTVGTLGPGNYTVVARNVADGLSSNATGFSLTNASSTVALNLTVVPSVRFALPLSAANGLPVAGYPVRFTPVPDTGGPSGTPSPQDSYTFFSSPQGIVQGTLPIGTYAVYGYGLDGSTFAVGLGTRELAPTLSVVVLPTLAVVPALTLRGTVSVPTNSSVTLTGISVTAFGSSGDPVTAFANASGGFALHLPPGNYSLLANYASGNVTKYAQVGYVATLPQSSLNLALVPAVRFSPTLGSHNSHGTLVPASSATVAVTPSTSLAVLVAAANATGGVSLLLPASLADGGTYCVQAGAAGYTGTSQCGYSPSALGSLSALPLTLNPVLAAVALPGLPAGATFTLNLTALSPTAENLSARSLAPVGISVFPGVYNVTGFATVSGSPGLYQPLLGSILQVPLGPATTTLSLPIFYQVRTVGTLTLPTGVTASSVNVELSSPTANLTVNGTVFTSHFFAPPGTYTAYASARVSNVTYAALTGLTVNGAGHASPAIALSSDTAVVNVQFLTPEGTPLGGSVPFTFSAPGPLTLLARTTAGTARLDLPASTTYSFALNQTQLATVNGTNEYRTYTVSPGYSCPVSGPSTNCSAPLVAQAHPASVNGTFTLGGASVLMNGLVRFEGPLPSTTTTTISVSAGTFRASLTPGVYSVYTTAGIGTGQLANLTAFQIDALSPNTLSVSLLSAWTASITIQPLASGLGVPPTLVLSSANGVTLTFPGAPVGTAMSWLLPTGVYTARANSTTAPYGVFTPASGSGTLALLQGNGALSLTLAPTFEYSAALAVQAPTTVHLGSAGGLATFSWTVRNTGTAPENLRLLGTPVAFGFTFSPSSVSLGVTGSSSMAGGVVTIAVPSGLLNNTPKITLAVLLPGGGLAGTASPAPTVILTPRAGLGLGPSSVATSVSARGANVTFYLANTGNVAQKVNLTVSNSARLLGLGWYSTILSGSAAVHNPVTLAAEGNMTFTLRLNATIPLPAPPGFATVSAQSVGTATPVQQTAVLPVPVTPVQFNSTSTVTGPSVGSPSTTPSWLIPFLSFVPAIAFLVGAFTYRWYRTRRWVR